MKKLVSFLLAAAMLLSLASTAVAADVQEIDVMVMYRDIDDLNFAEMPYYNDPETGITAITGVHANFNQVKQSDYSTKLNLMLASNEYPEIILRGGLNLEMYGVDQEILLPLDEYIDAYMPNYKALLDADPEMAQSLRSSDGKMYQIGWIIPQNINVNGHLFINETWLKNLGLELPTTLEDFEKCLIAIRDGDADGDGDTTDEIPYGGTWGSPMNGLHYAFSSFGIPANTSYVGIDDENKVYSWLQDDNLRAAVETLARWYQEGLIDLEAVSQDDNSFDAKLNACEYGAFYRWRMTAMGTDESVYSQYTCIVPPSANGIQPKLLRTMELPSFGAALTVTAEKNGNIEACCRWMDAQFQWDNMIDGYNGRRAEGFWDYDENGMVVLAPMDDGTRSVPGQSSLYYCPGELYFSKVIMPSHRIEKTTYCEMYEAAGILEKNSENVLASLVLLNVEESTEKDLMFAELDKFVEESMTTFIVKGVTDDSWTKYEKTLEQLRIGDLVNLYQGAYDRYLEANQ